nr:MAG TPA: hypothetical protein [Caudoviricetes sp.]
MLTSQQQLHKNFKNMLTSSHIGGIICLQVSKQPQEEIK